MANFNYFAFNPYNATDPLAGGTLALPILQNTATVPDGEICQPADFTKISPNPVYSQVDEFLTFQDSDGETISVAGITEADWNSIDIDYNSVPIYGASTSGAIFKETWLASWMTFLNLAAFINDPIFTQIFNDFNSSDNYKKLSGQSIAYLTQTDDTLELSLGLNAYQNTFFTDWLTTNSGTTVSEMRVAIKDTPHFTSNVGRITYSDGTHNVWSFDARQYSNYEGPGVVNGNISIGGGNYITEIKFAGVEYEAMYVVRKEVDPRDPTFGLCSGVGEPFCIGDQIYVIDTSTLTSRNYLGTGSGFDWTWMGSPSEIDREWYIANITNPCTDFANTPISGQLFPLRVISECIFADFN